jgi:hypothetical protein
VDAVVRGPNPPQTSAAECFWGSTRSYWQERRLFYRLSSMFPSIKGILVSTPLPSRSRDKSTRCLLLQLSGVTWAGSTAGQVKIRNQTWITSRSVLCLCPIPIKRRSRNHRLKLPDDPSLTFGQMPLDSRVPEQFRHISVQPSVCNDVLTARSRLHRRRALRYSSQ